MSPDFQQRIEPHAADLLRFVRRMLRRPQDAADVLQAALIGALESHARYDREASFKAWVFGFATREALNASRQARRRPSSLDDEAQVVAGVVDLELELAYELVLADPDRVLVRLDAPLARALSELSSRTRAAFLLRSLADFSCSEIASIMDIPKGTVVSWLFRARARLRAELADYARTVGFAAEGAS